MNFRSLVLVGTFAFIQTFSPIQSAVAMSDADRTMLREFLDSPTIETNLEKLHQLAPLARDLTDKPWAGYYWPDAFGSIAMPYRDDFPKGALRFLGLNGGFRRTERWFRNHRIDGRYPDFMNMSNGQLDVLSPSEKYDILMGDTNFTLTKAVLDDIATRVQKFGALKSWEGICNGWSLASLSTQRPLHPVTVPTPSGKQITFYPHDIQALAGLLYAESPINQWALFAREGDTRYVTRSANNGSTNVLDDQGRRYPQGNARLKFEPRWLKFLGWRCNRGQENGCKDLPPYLFHIAVAQVMGIEDSGFILDKQPKPSISNSPSFGYEIKFFSLKNGKWGTLAESVTEPQKANQRERGAKKVVGVKLSLKYTKELEPWTLNSSELSHYEDFEKFDTRDYVYSLELDAEGNIIDGEWQARMAGTGSRDRVIEKAPDFLWRLPKGWKAFSGYEGNILSTNWSSGAIVPETWKSVALQASKDMQPMGLVVEGLIQASR